jgi:pimeloyl-CoA synthetase
VNFFLLLDTVNSKFGYERLMNYKKKFMGKAWAGVVYFVSRAIELQQRLCRG